jgi:hypothetical protein
MANRSADRVNWTNIGLMAGSCAAALAAPFQVFLLAYAVLGPAHYLTEISWLHDRQYFAPRLALRRIWLWCVGAAMVAVTFGYVSNDLLGHPVTPYMEMALVAIAFAGAAAAVFATRGATAAAVVVTAGLAVAMVVTHPWFAIAAYLLVTLVHVLFFTGGFILLGALKSRSATGLLSFVVFAACAAVTLVAGGTSTPPDASVHASYSGFEQLNLVLLKLAGLRGTPVYGRTGIRVMQLIAFAYLYHYLNWFSKTSIIRWHEVPRPRAIALVAFWAAGLAVYLINYRVGFAVFYVVSILHVLLEFPLNHQMLAGLPGAWRSGARPQPAKVRRPARSRSR